ncbi:hypothetical protein MKK75_04895 [Methylobacterium sp. J-030]|uniref:hypothetical protein n=1 Tax=Methylobacterium sp. J-030 TaxID=2836627 RepID=UPI001FBA892B|nr:hypothetical protein [Methylobacterium sp. J-030]MCJ2068153.1 hypothetical protein [Methylobacterium sp. J-030]
MDQKAIEIILRYYMEKLPEGDLRELDALLEGTSLDTPQPERASTPAMDTALGDRARQEFMRLGPTARKAIRAGRTVGLRGMATDSAEAKEYRERFPNAGRLTGTGY